MFDAIPDELKALRQWIVWRYETTPTGRTTKVPYSPITGHLASVTDASHWADWFTANAALAQHGFSGLGFVLTNADPYTFIDLDNAEGEPTAMALQDEVYRLFGASYQELSPSGKGLHIIVRGVVPTGKGKRRHSVEVYSSERYMTMTGNQVAGRERLPILEQQSNVEWLWSQLGGDDETNQAFEGTYQDAEPDEVILERASNASNGGKFLDLWHGRWEGHYPSQSEADFALIDILAYYTVSVFQVARLFRASALGDREKASRDDYVMKMVKRAFDRHPPPMDLTVLKANLQDRWEEIKAAKPPKAGEVFDRSIMPPVTGNPYLDDVPGLVGKMAYYFYQISPRPVPEIALASAIGLMAGITGRSYNISGTGLNQYIMLLAGTGRGKESVHDGISRLMEWVSSVGQGGGGCPGAREFIGPGDIASGQALIKYMDNTSKSFVTVQGEIDLTLKQFIARNANASQLKLKQILLSCYSRSGKGKVLEPLIYSDKDKNTGAILSPAITLLGEGTPDRFFGLLDEALIADGMLPRFTVIYYEGHRVQLNTSNLNLAPPADLIRQTAALCGQSLQLNQRNAVIDVKMDDEAKAILDDYDVRITAVINAAHNDTIEQIWNRAHLKALKLAATIAVGCNFSNPMIDAKMARYAINVVSYDTFRLVAKFQSGDIGESESRQVNDLRRIMRRYLRAKPDDVEKFGATRLMHEKWVIPKRMLQQRTANQASFRGDRLGAGIALNRTLLSLVEAGVIEQLGPLQTVEYAARNAKLFVLMDRDWVWQGEAKEEAGDAAA
jgi:hypothetical protein